jgi:hypothetical protein
MGLHLKILQIVFNKALKKLYFLKLSFEYSEQDGINLQNQIALQE